GAGLPAPGSSRVSWRDLCPLGSAPMPVHLKIQLVSVAEDGSESIEDLLVLTKEHERLEQLGLTLGEGKQLLREVQRRIVQQQATAFLATQTACPTCGRERSTKDHKTLGLRTLFGKLSLDSPRVRQCCRQAGEAASISPLIELISERSTPGSRARVTALSTRRMILPLRVLG